MSAQKTFKQFIEEKWLRGDLENYYGNTSRKNTRRMDREHPWDAPHRHYELHHKHELL